MKVSDQRNAIIGAAVWWYLRRAVRQRSARAVATVTGAPETRGRTLRTVVGGVLLVGLLAGALVALRRIVGGDSSVSPITEPPLSATGDGAPVDAPAV